MPGPIYDAWLERIHDRLQPRTYLEIGIATGHSLSRVHPETHVIGVDPAFEIARDA